MTKEEKAIKIIYTKAVDIYDEIRPFDDYDEYLNHFESVYEEGFLLQEDEWKLLKGIYNEFWGY